MGIAGNKFDLYHTEEVSEEEGRKFANEVNAFFYLTSAKDSIGINELFFEVAKKFNDYKNNNQFRMKDLDAKNLSNKSSEKKKKKIC